jgi:cytochrome c biogenesis protein ResB
MEAGKTLPRGERPRPYGWSRAFSLLNPLRAVWWLFTNVRFAIFLLAVLCLVSLIGVLVPQMPLVVRGDPVAEAQWLDGQDSNLGFLAGLMERLGLFHLFQSAWFAMLLAVTVASTGAYVLSRLPAIWTSITRPRKRVPDRYFALAPHRVQATGPVNLGLLEQRLRRAWYRVDRFQEGEATYLFADRHQWAHLGTVLTHVAIIVFILSAAVSRMDAIDAPLFLAEGSTLPVFPVHHPQQMQVELVDSHAAFAEDGRALEYRSDLVIYERGEEVKRCSSTVNSPCAHNSFRFYQAAYYGFGAALQVRDLSTGNVVYRDTFALTERTPAPHVVIRDSTGRVLLDAMLVLTDELYTGDSLYLGRFVELPGGRLLSIGVTQPVGGAERRLLVLEPGAEHAALALSLREGESAEARGLHVSYARESMTVSAFVDDLPGAAWGEWEARPRLQMTNAVFGASNVAAGDSPAVAPPPPGAEPQLTVSGVSVQPFTLDPGQSAVAGGYEYTFLGQREFSGIHVRRDRSETLVWAGSALIVAGIMITFWVPRRRLWAKITGTGASFAGQAPAHANYTRELRELAQEAGGLLEGREEDD